VLVSRVVGNASVVELGNVVLDVVDVPVFGAVYRVGVTRKSYSVGATRVIADFTFISFLVIPSCDVRGSAKLGGEAVLWVTGHTIQELFIFT
jgi:hypothetical protein